MATSDKQSVCGIARNETNEIYIGDDCALIIFSGATLENANQGNQKKKRNKCYSL